MAVVTTNTLALVRRLWLLKRVIIIFMLSASAVLQVVESPVILSEQSIE